MIALLEFLIHYGSKLFERPGFKFRDSLVGQSSAAGSWILLESADVQVYISNERGGITWEMRSLHDSNKKNWFSFDLISALLGRPIATGVMTLPNSLFLSSNIEAIISRFKKEEVVRTIKKLNELKAERGGNM